MTHIVTQETIKATKAYTAAYISGLVEKPRDFMLDDFESIHPSEMKIGDHMGTHNFAYEIDEIKVSQPNNLFGREDNGPVYCVSGTYVSGSLEMYKYFLGDAENGCATDHRSYDQGNALATWSRLIK